MFHRFVAIRCAERFRFSLQNPKSSRLRFCLQPVLQGAFIEMEGLSKLALKRLVKEMKDRDASPLAGLALTPASGDDMTAWHGNMTMMDGAYSGINLHLLMEIPNDYPNKAPSLYFRSKIHYQNGAQMEVAGKGTSVCLNLLGNFANVHTEWGNGDAAGWSPGNTLQTVLIQLQGSLSDMLSGSLTDIAATKKSSLELKCVCGHHGANTNTFHPPLPVFETSLAKEMDYKTLYTELLAECDLLKSKALAYDEIVGTIDRLRIGGAPISPAAALVEAEIPKKPELSYKHIECCVSGSTYDDDKTEIFGFGVAVNDNASLSTSGELLSKSAFDGGVRKSSTNDVFQHFLPIFISADHWNRSKNVFQDCIKGIYTSLNGKRRKNSAQTQTKLELMATEIICSLMNSAVLATSENNGRAHDKFISCYFALLRELKFLAKNFKTVSSYADQEIESFYKGKRTKNDVANLGDFLVLLHASRHDWAFVSDQFFGEVDARNVRWFKDSRLQSTQQFSERSALTFSEAAISRKIVCFQVRFLAMSQKTNLETFVDLNVPEELLKALKNIHALVAAHKSWNDYKLFLQLPPGDRNAELIRAVDWSSKCGYHGGKKGGGGRRR